MMIARTVPIGSVPYLCLGAAPYPGVQVARERLQIIPRKKQSRSVEQTRDEKQVAQCSLQYEPAGQASSLVHSAGAQLERVSSHVVKTLEFPVIPHSSSALQVSLVRQARDAVSSQYEPIGQSASAAQLAGRQLALASSHSR